MRALRSLLGSGQREALCCHRFAEHINNLPAEIALVFLAHALDVARKIGRESHRPWSRYRLLIFHK